MTEILPVSLLESSVAEPMIRSDTFLHGRGPSEATYFDKGFPWCMNLELQGCRFISWEERERKKTKDGRFNAEIGVVRMSKIWARDLLVLYS